MEDQPNKKKPYLPRRYHFRYRGEKCRNCQHPLDLSDKFCANCGQINSEKKVTVLDLFDEFFGSLISYDSRLRKTLAALLLKPGKISMEYIDGKRASYTNPFRFLLSLCIVYFLLLGYSTNFETLNSSLKKEIKLPDRETSDRIIDSVTTQIAKAEELRKEGGEATLEEQQLKDTLLATLDTLQGATEILALLGQRQDSLALADPLTYYKEIKADTSDANSLTTLTGFYFRVIKNGHFYDKAEAETFLNNPITGRELWAFRIGKSAAKIADQPGTFLNTVISRLPFFIFFFLPVFTLFIWLLYIRHRFSYMDHLIFSFHTQSLFIILLMFAYLAEWLTNWDLLWIALLLFMGYLYKAMRNFYRQGRLKTILKFTILNTIFVILAGMALVLFLSGSALTY